MEIKLLNLAVGISLLLAISNSNAQVLEVKGKANSDYAQTKYPLLFVHGMFGFSKLGTPEFGMDYWYQILPDLKRNGARPFAAQLSPLNSTEVRGEQLLQDIDDVLALTGQDKINLIGHSHGGPTARYISGVAPEKVASITTVGGSNFGSPIADFVQGAKPLNTVFAAIVDYMISPIISFSQLRSNLPSDFKASIHDLTYNGSQAFNAKFPLGLPTEECGSGPDSADGISFYSWTGTAITTNILDPDTTLTAAGFIAFNGQKNDGLVSQCSSKFGKTIRDDYKLNHFDEVNQVLGLKSWTAPDPVSLYRQHANRLKLEGL